jgi:hypothetical protein
VYNAAVTTGNELPSSAAAVRNITINAPGTVTLNKDVVVNNTLTFTKGKLELGSNNLTVLSPSGVNGGSDSGFVVTNGAGAVKIRGLGVTGTTTTVTFPVGYDAGNYTPVQVKNTGVLDDYSVRLTDQLSDNYAGGQPTGTTISNNVVNKTWHIDETNAGGSQVTITLLWKAANEGPAFNRNNCGVGHFKNGGWDKAPSLGAAGYIASSGLYSMSRGRHHFILSVRGG